MDRLQFEVPVRIAPAPGLPVEEIYSVEQALDVLHDWPSRRQGKVYEAAFNACFGATVDVVKTEDACRAFMAFCRVSGLLARDMMVTAKRAAARRGACGSRVLLGLGGRHRLARIGADSAPLRFRFRLHS